MLHHDFDVYQQRFYLTPSGWKETQPQKLEEAIEIWELDIYQPAGWAREYHDWTCMWATPLQAWSSAARDTLREKFPFPDKRREDVRSVLNVGFPLAGATTDESYLVA